ncbi:hypothetical protein H310_14657 [Aphanomyces invadans]|uniref:Uncharacterized protein n=1 Tax=Aphanomyces invadans TaxID=157072 RepID=A0A024T8V4_9STRA|nr:hypothetical protein H310_14657 [Aphanomyces invadans]ETV90590.1 hypothetical protein H310_14657 [Aphanomyces invadans]|eukprot:XP_008880776.1 hypothetical protein H310_14657 [Aphanomyces invadans]
MKRNGFDLVAHAQYLASVAARVAGGEDPRAIPSYRKHKYHLQRQHQAAALAGTIEPSVELALPSVEDVAVTVPGQPSVCCCPEHDTVVMSTDATMSKSCNEFGDPAVQARHAYLMQLICPALRHTKTISLHTVPTHAADALQQARPCARDGASLTTCGDVLVLFGGCYIADPSLLHPRTLVPPRQTAKSTVFYSHHVFCYMPESNVWDVPRLSGSFPPGRADHSAVYVAASSTLIVFGGRGKHAVVFQDLFCLRVHGGGIWTWSEPKAPASTNIHVPPPRFWHCAAFDPDANSMFVFGGKDLYSVYGDMRQLHDMRTWSTVAALGQPPSPRFGATMQWLGPGQLAILAGWEARPVPLRDENRWLDVFILDVVAGIWSRPHLSAHFLGRTIPTERMLAATFLLDSTTLVVFGGYTYGRDASVRDERPWFELEPPPRTVGLPTPTRYMHGMKLEPVPDQAIFTLKLDVMVWRRQPRHAMSLPTSVMCGAGAVWRGQGILAAISHHTLTEMELVAVMATPTTTLATMEKEFLLHMVEKFQEEPQFWLLVAALICIPLLVVSLLAATSLIRSIDDDESAKKSQ